MTDNGGLNLTPENIQMTIEALHKAKKLMDALSQFRITDHHRDERGRMAGKRYLQLEGHVTEEQARIIMELTKRK